MPNRETPRTDAKMTDPSCLETLADLRIEIDRIDASLHRLLIERGEIIHRLIEAKARQGGGSAFRPGREADMMRAPRVPPSGSVAARHGRKHLADHHLDLHLRPGELQRACRYFRRRCPDARLLSVPFRFYGSLRGAPRRGAGHRGGREVKRRSRRGAGRGRSHGRYLGGAVSLGRGRPKIIARLPFVERPDHPAGMPLFVIAQPLAEAAVRDVVLYEVDDPACGRPSRRRPGAPRLEILGRF